MELLLMVVILSALGAWIADNLAELVIVAVVAGLVIAVVTYLWPLLLAGCIGIAIRWAWPHCARAHGRMRNEHARRLSMAERRVSHLLRHPSQEPPRILTTEDVAAIGDYMRLKRRSENQAG